MLDLDGTIFTVVGGDPRQRPTVTRSWDTAISAMSEQGVNQIGGVFTCPEQFRLETEYNIGGWLLNLTVYDSNGSVLGEIWDLATLYGADEDCWGRYFEGEHDVFHASGEGWVVSIYRGDQRQYTHVVGNGLYSNLLSTAIQLVLGGAAWTA